MIVFIIFHVITVSEINFLSANVTKAMQAEKIILTKNIVQFFMNQLNPEAKYHYFNMLN